MEAGSNTRAHASIHVRFPIILWHYTRQDCMAVGIAQHTVQVSAFYNEIVFTNRGISE